MFPESLQHLVLFLPLEVLQKEVREACLWVLLKPTPQMMNASHGAHPLGINIHKATSSQTPYPACDGFTAVTSSALISPSFSPFPNMLINIPGWIFTYLHTIHLLWKKTDPIPILGLDISSLSHPVHSGPQATVSGSGVCDESSGLPRASSLL